MNHKIRREAAEDADFVKRLCEKWDCPFFYEEKDVEAYAENMHISTEEAGRKLRYELFERVLEQLGAKEGKIAVAHNQNDCAETVLFHLMRGTGLAGMAGIRPVRGQIIRPLLCISRKEIEAFLLQNGLPYCIDKTNDEDTYTRNKIRHHILPYGEAEICEGATAHIFETARIIATANDFVRKSAEEALLRCMKKQGDTPEKDDMAAKGDTLSKNNVHTLHGEQIIFSRQAFLAEDNFLQQQMLLLALERLTENRKGIGAVHVEQLMQLFLREGNGACDLPGELYAKRSYDTVVIEKERTNESRDWENASQGTAKELLIPGETVYGGGCFVCKVFPYEKSQIIPRKTYTKWFDYDKIVKSLVLRTRETGDYLEVTAAGGRKALKAYFINEKIPQEERDRIPLIADGNHILWVVGRRISEHYKVNEKTKTVLEIQFVGGTWYDREG